MLDEWTVASLDYIYDFSSGLSKPREEFGFGYGFLSFKDVFYHYFIPEKLEQLVNSTEKEQQTCSIERGDVFLTRTSETMDELGMSCVALKNYERATFNGFTKRLRPKIAAQIVPEYAGYYFRSPSFRREVTAMSSLSTRASLNNEMLSRLKIVLPPINTQYAIGSILKALDDKIELNRRMNATLEGMARALFQSWFVDFDPVRAKLDGRKPEGMDKATAALFPDGFEESAFGPVPKGWAAGKIQDCCIQIQNGGTPRRNEPRFWDGGNIPWLASGEVRQSIITATESFITEEGLAESSAKWVPAFSTVVALYGATAGQVSLTSSRLTTNQAVCALIPKKHFALFNYLTMGTATAELENKAVGSAQQNISKGIVEETGVILPPPDLAERFTVLASPLFERWIFNLHQSRTIATLRDTLIPKLLSGELSVASIQKPKA
jgi:type I restriction enzyme S subunit